MNALVALYEVYVLRRCGRCRQLTPVSVALSQGTPWDDKPVSASALVNQTKATITVMFLGPPVKEVRDLDANGPKYGRGRCK